MSEQRSPAVWGRPHWRSLIRSTKRKSLGGSQDRRLQPRAEGLEDRLLLYSTLGGQWAFGSRITYSFVPDGTSVGGIPSAWQQTMTNLGIDEQVWKGEFRRAAATWQSVTGINFVEVADDGSAFSVSGNQQNDTRFGDIRIAGIDQGPSTLGVAFYPPPFNGGTLAGDIVMNTEVAWNINTTYDIRTVAIHEFGHALGMGHSTITSAVMYDYYTGTKQSLATDDINGIRSLYGTRPQDFFDASASNQFWSNATNVTSYIDSNKQVRIASLDITTSSDVDWYRVTAPAGSGYWLTAAVQSQHLSSLSPSIIVYNNALQVLGSASAANSFGATVVTYVPAIVPGQQYYIRAQAANGGPSGNGSYALLLNFGVESLSLVPPPDTTVPEQPNQGGGWTPLQRFQELINQALGDLQPGLRRRVERVLADYTDASTGIIDLASLATDLQPALADLNPAARLRIEEVLASSTSLHQIGDLVGFASALTTADLAGSQGLSVGSTVATARPEPWRGGSPDSGQDPSVFVVLTSADPDAGVVNLVTRARGRERLAGRVVDHVLETWRRS